MSPLDKMWASFVALGCMAIASLLITYARNRTKGAVRIVLSVVAFALLVLMVPFALLSMF
jgi:predicted membrane protein